MVELVTTFFVPVCDDDASDPEFEIKMNRRRELVDALERNVDCAHIQRIHLFITAPEDLLCIDDRQGKIVPIIWPGQPIYSDYFSYILENLPDAICMIANSDIYLRDCDIELIHQLKRQKVAYALTRYEHDMSCYLIDHYLNSHDCYLFCSRFIDSRIISEHTNYKQNLPGIESHIISNFVKSGFEVKNPCRQIVTVHLRQTGLRTHGQWVGLHTCGNDHELKTSCWYIPPTLVELEPETPIRSQGSRLDDNRPSIIVSPDGGLGNQMFQIFAALAYGLELNRPVTIVPSQHKTQYLNTIFRYLEPRVDQNRLLEAHQFREDNYEILDRGTILNKHVVIGGRFQHLKYFDAYFDYIMQQTRLPHMRRDVIEKYANDDTNRICMHFRRGDYKTLRCYHLLLDEFYYIHALKNAIDSGKFKGKISVVCFCEQADKEEVMALLDKIRQDPEINRSDVEFSFDLCERMTDWEQMLYMSTFRHHITSNGTFSWWSAYLSRKLSPNTESLCTIPKHMFSHNLYYLKSCGLYLPGSILIDSFDIEKPACDCGYLWKNCFVELD